MNNNKELTTRMYVQGCISDIMSGRELVLDVAQRICFSLDSDQTSDQKFKIIQGYLIEFASTNDMRQIKAVASKILEYIEEE